MPARLPVASGLLCIALCFALPAMAQQVGLVIDVTPGARLEADGGSRELRARDRLSNGDVIVTDGTGTAQIVFTDRTRVAIGPGSRFEVEEIGLGANRKANRFAVKAVSGAFRFISGRSDKPAYAISTPTATMGIRGTKFDFSVVEGRTTNLITFRGEVRICSNRGNCARARGGCAAVGATRAGRIVQPEDEAARNALIISEFPFILSQEALRPQFRADVESCGDVAAALPLTEILKEGPQNEEKQPEPQGKPDDPLDPND